MNGLLALGCALSAASSPGPLRENWTNQPCGLTEYIAGDDGSTFFKVTVQSWK